jgi:hypothetical protein
MENVIVFCCACGDHYPLDIVKEVRPEATQSKYYICLECLDAMPVTEEVKKFEVIK